MNNEGNGDSGIEGEHRVQVDLIRALGDAVKTGGSAATISTILEQLIAFSDMHFMSEELLMRLASYDGYADHVADHARMIEALDTMRENLRAGKLDLLAGGTHTVLAFLLRHIATRDARFTDSAGRS